MTKTKAFTSFDFEHDEDLRVLFVGQSRNPNAPFEIADWSLKEALPGNWKEKVRSRIRKVDKVIVICGETRISAIGVSEEIRMSREENKPYYLINGRKGKVGKKPKAALPEDKVLPWTWNIIAAIMKKSAPHPKSPVIEQKHLPRVRSVQTTPRVRTVSPVPLPRVRTVPLVPLPRIRTPRMRTLRIR